MKMMRIVGLFAMLAVFAGQGLQSAREQPGGHGLPCDVSPVNSDCYVVVSGTGAAGCSDKSVVVGSWFGDETKKQAQNSTGACSDYNDSARNACGGATSIDTLTNYLCVVDNPWTSW